MELNFNEISHRIPAAELNERNYFITNSNFKLISIVAAAVFEIRTHGNYLYSLWNNFYYILDTEVLTGQIKTKLRTKRIIFARRMKRKRNDQRTDFRKIRKKKLVFHADELATSDSIRSDFLCGQKK